MTLVGAGSAAATSAPTSASTAAEELQFGRWQGEIYETALNSYRYPERRDTRFEESYRYVYTVDSTGDSTGYLLSEEAMLDGGGRSSTTSTDLPGSSCPGTHSREFSFELVDPVTVHVGISPPRVGEPGPLSLELPSGHGDLHYEPSPNSADGCSDADTLEQSAQFCVWEKMTAVGGLPADALKTVTEEIDGQTVTHKVIRTSETYNCQYESPDGTSKVSTRIDISLAFEPGPTEDDPCTLNPVTCYAPLNHIHPDEQSRPMSANEYLSSTRLFWASRAPFTGQIAFGKPDPARLGGSTASPYSYGPVALRNGYGVTRKFASSEITRPYTDLCSDEVSDGCKDPAIGNKANGFFLRLTDSALDSGVMEGASFEEIRSGAVPAYYQYEPGKYISYWFFSPHSVPGTALTGDLLDRIGIDHQADWEHITVVLDDDNQPLGVDYFFHHWHQYVPWSDVYTVNETHPVVYSANGGHGSYWSTDCDFRVEHEITRLPSGRTFDECADEGEDFEWKTWENLVDVHSEPWYGFGGAWGDVATGGSLAADRTAPMAPHPDVDPRATSAFEAEFLNNLDALADLVPSQKTPPVTVNGQLDFVINSPFAPGSTAWGVAHSDPLDLGSFTVSNSGTIAVSVNVSAGLAPGRHTVELTGRTAVGVTQTLTVPIVVAGSGGFFTDRVAGADRYEAAVNVSIAAHPDGAPVVYLVTGSNYPDALSAAPAAIKEGGPLLLTSTNSLLPSVAEEIKRLKPAKVVIVGGINSISVDVFNKVKSIQPNTVRIGGADRYEASRNIFAYAFPGRVRKLYLATGANFPDALSAGAAAGSIGAPVLLIRGSTVGPDAATRALLNTAKPTSLTIAGGPNSVSTSMEAALRKVAPVTRLGGADRFAASANINRDAFASSSRAFLVTGLNFPDALSGSAWAGTLDAPLYVTRPDCVPVATLQAMQGQGVGYVTLIGGTASLTTKVESLTPCA